MSEFDPHDKNRQINIAERVIDDDSPCYVIAEIGCNHQGDEGLCKTMIHLAHEAGADAVKLQKRNNRKLFTEEFFGSPYTGAQSFGLTYGQHRENLELTDTQFRLVYDFATDLGITLFATPFDLDSAAFLASLDMPAFKVASGDLTNTPLIERLASYGKPMILSTGGSNLDDVRRALQIAQEKCDQVALLQCTSAYPVEPEQINLAVIDSFRAAFPTTVIGYSGHDVGIEASLFAIAHGARIVEKHFTLDRTMKGTDQAFSLISEELKQLVSAAHLYKRALGSGVKQRQSVEHLACAKLGKKIVFARALPAGSMITPQDVELRSPADGIAAKHLHQIFGRHLSMPVQAGDDVEWSSLDRDEHQP